MKNMKNIFYLAALVLFATALFSSCSDDEYDVKGDTSIRVYLADNTTTYDIVQTSVGTFGSIEYETVVRCTNPAKNDLTITLGFDSSLVEAYNESNGTEYVAMPDGVLSLENATLTIPAGEMVSSGSCRISSNNLSSLTNENGYIAPLRITSLSGKNAQESVNVYSTYLIASVTFDEINHDASEDDITGTLVEDQSGWTATTTGSVSTSSRYSQLDAIFDGDETTYAYITYSGSCDLEVDMGKQYSFDGIYMAYSTGRSISGSFSSSMTIYTSNDGSNWTEVGQTTGTSTYVAFYGAQTARYIKITKATSSSWNIGVFNVYAK